MYGEDYEYDVETGYLKEYPDFKSSSSIPVKLGWKAILNDDEEAIDGKGLGKMAKSFVHEGFPPKPTLPTYAWLMNQLDKYDVGTGATRVATFAEISKDKQASSQFENKKGKITFTQTGDVAYEMARGTNIGSLEVTKELTRQMKDVEKGVDPKTYLDDMARLVNEDIRTMIENTKNIKMEDTMNEEVEKVEGLFNGVQIRFKREWSGHRFTDDEVRDLLDGKVIHFQAMSAKTGNPYNAKGQLKQQEFNGNKFWGFAPDFSKDIPNEFLGYKFTENEKNLLKSGQMIHVEGLISKKGNAFGANLAWNANDGLKMSFDN